MVDNALTRSDIDYVAVSGALEWHEPNGSQANGQIRPFHSLALTVLRDPVTDPAKDDTSDPTTGVHMTRTMSTWYLAFDLREEQSGRDRCYIYLNQHSTGSQSLYVM
jgi:hypothetical protein